MVEVIHHHFIELTTIGTKCPKKDCGKSTYVAPLMLSCNDWTIKMWGRGNQSLQKALKVPHS